MNISRPSAPNTRLQAYCQALLPVAADAEPAGFCTVLKDGGAEFLELVAAQGLVPLWHHVLQENSMLESLQPDAIEVLQRARMAAAARYLAQRTALAEIDRRFESAGIPYAVMKGAHLRECVYPDPSLRLSGDIDFLVAPADRALAARVLLDAGYTAHAEPATISHEVCFSCAPVDIDLHWNILRPGRTRADMTAGLLARRQRINGLWVLSDTDALFLMLVHPAFTKYVCSPNLGLTRVADFLLWIQNRPTDWPAVVRLLDTAGLKAAAWTMLSWYRMLAAPQAAAVIDSWLIDVQPGRTRSTYLRYWLAHDLPSRWLNRPFLIQFGLTLFLHDHPADAGQALLGWWRSRRSRHRDMRLLLGEG